MKNKFIIFTLCFTIIFTNISLSFNKSYANNIDSLVVDGGVVTAPMVAVVATVAVACGVSFNDDSDLYDIAYIFYEKYKDNQEVIKNAFDLGVSIATNKVVTVSKDFVDLVTSAFDDYVFQTSDSPVGLFIPGYGLFEPIIIETRPDSYFRPEYGKYMIEYNYKNVSVYYDGSSMGSIVTSIPDTVNSLQLVDVGGVPYLRYGKVGVASSYGLTELYYPTGSGVSVNSFPGFNDYDSDKISDKVEEGSLGLYMPGYLGDLIGKNPSDVVSDGVNVNPYDSPYDDLITLPVVDNPSVDSSLEGTFNSSLDTDVPDADIWSTINDFIVSLVVPSDNFWTDTFNSFRDNLNKNFPMLDMSVFDSLLVNGKPFPNIYAFGSIVVNGDIINSIVDWLRPIVSGFVMLLLLFFNYRKLHKIIRNSEPYGSVAEKGCTSNVN